ncbi:MAG TPA: hypothetical protein VFW21_02040 [Mycobacterium sp.]|nr:hypothetical protein [Mycobacterium sp.]
MTADDEKSVAKHTLPEESGSDTAAETAEVTEATGTEVTSAAADTDTSEADTASADKAATSTTADAAAPPTGKRRRRFGQSRVLAYVVLPVVAVLLAVAAGLAIWKGVASHGADQARTESLQVAKDSTARLLSYKPDTVEADLTSAQDLLTGTFKDSYTQLTHDVVIPGAKDKHISAVANVPAVASVSASSKHAVALVFVNQTVIVGDGAPTATASSVKVTMDKVNGRWLISGFDPV